ncbi:16S rRNA (adenine(1518)-N(6)/adenine(1519)-N(6))-dimethyltransferase RsmA [Pelagibius marinus]|uniref:16S rRNA (adenine(1518)-N(6)/adenine(1519)-N(6))- dimethyltransferase RsmA n=1 Tax=Pelagibius marinus TaxID=2762760 RepID=UPI0018725DCF|nr:16S rRNA (adenine(1518)-N(6)/adenine(1519)-N(6))-dimethyltransferase RsmA [Pelagibius marinus]
MTVPADLPPLREVIARHGLGARKALGQHFLLDLNLTGRIARAAPGIGEGSVIEVGPGPGGLTRALLAEGAARVIAVEKDSRCLEALAELAAAYPGRLEVVEGDALELDLGALGAAPRQIVSNLPYNISTALLVRWLTTLAGDPRAFSAMTLMFQKEVAERLIAAPRSRDYGRLSVLTQWLCQARPLFDIPPRAFTPPPKVTSTVVSIIPREQPLAPASLTTLEKVTAAAFGQRRKMLRQSLKSLGGKSEGGPAAWLEATGIAPTARAEELSVEDFCALAACVDRG